MQRDIDLVTGGLGFTGRKLVERLRAGGGRVRVLDVAEPDERFQDVEYHQGDVTDAATVRRAVQGVRRVYHMAAKTDLWAADRGTFAAVIEQGTRHVLAAAEAESVERLVYTSSETVKSPPVDGAGNGAAASEMPRQAGPYCRAKYRAEQAVLQAARDGLPATIVSPTLPIGPGDVNLTPPSRMLLGFLNGQMPAFLESTMNVVDVRDLADAHIAAAERGEPGRRYVIGNETVQLSELLAMLGEVSGVKMPRLRVPYPLALSVAAVSEVWARYVTHRPPLATVTGVRLARRPVSDGVVVARRELDLKMRPLRESLADAVRWFDEQGLLRHHPRLTVPA